MQDCRALGQISSTEHPMALPMIEVGLFDILPGKPLPLVDFSGPYPLSHGALPLASTRAALPEGLTLMAKIGADGTLVELCGVSGLGHWRGALATTGDDGGITVFGNRQQDMAVAANAVLKAGGGVAVTEGEWINALIRLPARDIATDFDLAETARDIENLRDAIDGIVTGKPQFLLKKLMGVPLAPDAKNGNTPDLGSDSDYPMVAAE